MFYFAWARRKFTYIQRVTKGERRMRRPASIAPPKGKLGILTPGMGAVSTTFMAGVDLVRRGESIPVGSVTQMGTIRLGKRTENRTPKIKEFVKLADLNDLVFGGWDVFPDSAYTGGVQGGRAGREGSRQGRKIPEEHQADEGRIRPELRETSDRHAREERQRTSSNLPSKFARTSATSRKRTNSTGW